MVHVRGAARHHNEIFRHHLHDIDLIDWDGRTWLQAV